MADHLAGSGNLPDLTGRAGLVAESIFIPAKKPVQMSSLKIRLVKENDSTPLADLSGQLGYLSTPEQIKVRLAGIFARPDQAVFVAEVDGQVAGWVHVFACPTVELDLYAEVGSLVVDQDQRGCGIGKALMEKAEAWARQRRIYEVRLRSNVIREEAHQFYETIGYEKIKSQFTFHKVLP
jgi:GNAT superfamily N-acetyltransferase